MKCGSCNQDTRRIHVLPTGREICPNCTGMSEAGGAAIDGILTRSSFRNRTEVDKYAVDTLQPFTYDKTTRKPVINDDFVKHYPEHADTHFTPGQLRRQGYKKLPKKGK